MIYPEANWELAFAMFDFARVFLELQLLLDWFFFPVRLASILFFLELQLLLDWFFFPVRLASILFPNWELTFAVFDFARVFLELQLLLACFSPVRLASILAFVSFEPPVLDELSLQLLVSYLAQFFQAFPAAILECPSDLAVVLVYFLQRSVAVLPNPALTTWEAV